MIYVNDQNHMDADEVHVAEPSEVAILVSQGWRILAVFSTQEPEIVCVKKPVTVVSEVQQYGAHSEVVTDVPVITTKIFFVMGRSSEQASLCGRLEIAKFERRNAEQNVAAVESMHAKAKEVIEGLEGGQRSLLDTVKTQTEIATRATEKLLELQHQAGLVRKEIGEAKWREILHALEIEDVLGR